MNNEYDFAGWCTKNDLRCSDGRIIRHNAFKECDGERVPLVWNHQHDNPENILGHADLVNMDDGVYAYCKFNESPSGENGRELVRHGDIRALSIYANKLKQQGDNVLHGKIKEVSLVLAGANPGACIDSVLMHGELSDEEAVIYTDEEIDINGEALAHACGGNDEKKKKELEHANKNSISEVFASMTDEQKKAVKTLIKAASDNSIKVTTDIVDIFNGMDDNQKTIVYAMVGNALAEEKELEHADNSKSKGDRTDMADKTVKEIFDTLNEDQKTVVYAMIGQAIEDTIKETEGKVAENMKHNAFDEGEMYLQHSDIDTEAIFSDFKRFGSLKESVLQHGIDNIEYLFPDDKAIENAPFMIKREDEWVRTVMNGVRHTPFSRVKSIAADITAEEARAKGYIKGNYKTEEALTLLKRSTTPTTIYKKQKLHRDDISDINDFDIVAWLKTEMRGMLNEEIARAVLVSDGRSLASEDKINEQNVRPIWTDDDLYTIKAKVTVPADATDDQKAKAFIRGAIKSRKNYKGSGNPTLFADEDVITECLLMEDLNGHVIYETMDKLKAALRVKDIVTVPVMEGLTRTVNGEVRKLAGIIVNLADYNIGADKGGSVNMFDDFDIDYNAQKYLIETRISGALIRPYSAIAIEVVEETVTA